MPTIIHAAAFSACVICPYTCGQLLPCPASNPCRYNLAVTLVIFNNGGIYGGDRREAALRAAAAAGLAAAGHGADPAPTAFVPNAR